MLQPMKPDNDISKIGRSYALTRLILIDSYSRGRIVEMPLAGGSVLTGRNGQGKTTLLLILPLFHGESPSRIVHRTPGRETFIQHYLPNTTSYIIFEYEREPGQLCLAIHTADVEGRHLQHRFVRSAFSPELFMDDGNRIIETTSIGAHLRQMGVPVSQQIMSQSVYRNILHNTPQRGERMQRELAAMYSIVPRGGRLVGVERIIMSMFSRQTNFDDLQNIAVQTLREGDANVSLLADRGQAERWILDRQSYEDVMRLEPVWKSAETDYQAYNIAVQEILHSASRLKAFENHASNRLQEIEDEIASNEDKLAYIKSTERPELNDIIHDIARTKGELKALEGESQKHEQARLSFEKAGIDAISREIDDLPAHRVEVEQLNARLNALQGEATEIRSRIDDQRRIVQHDLEGLVAAIRQKRDEFDTAIQHRRNDAESQHQEAEDRLRARHATENDEIGSEMEGLASQLALAQHELRDPVVDEAIRDAVAGAEAVLRHKRAEETEARRRQTVAREIHHAAEREHEQSERDLERADLKLANAHQQLERATAFVLGPTGSLLNLLRADQSPNLDRLARVLDDQVLLHRGLKPRHAEDSATLYGYELEIDSLPPSPHSDIDSAREQQRLASMRHEEAIAAHADARTHNMAKAKARELARRDRDVADQIVVLAETASRTAEDDHGRALELERDAKTRAKAEAEERVSQIQNVLSDVRNRKASLISQQAQTLASIRASHRLLLEDLNREQHDERAASDKRVEEANASAKQRYAELDADLAAALSAAGVDAKLIAAIEADIANCRRTIQRLTSQQAAVDRWRSWRDTEPANEIKRQITIGEYRAMIERDTAAAERLEREIATKETAIDEATKNLRQEERHLANLRVKAGGRIGQAAEHGPIPAPEPWRLHDDFGVVIDNLNKAEAGRRQSKESLRGNTQQLSDTFRTHPGTQAYEFLTQGRHADAGSEPLFGFRNWYEHAHEETRRLLVSQARGIADSIRGFYRQLHDFQEQTKKFNRDLQTHLGQATSFDGVENLTIEVVSKVADLDYWDRVQTVTEAADHWLVSDRQGAMPDENFEEALSSLLEIWRRSGSLQTDLRSLIRIQGEVTEKGTLKKFTTAKQLENISSNGLSYLILVSIFVAFLNRMRAGALTTITWPLDELRSIDAENTSKLVNLLHQNRIELVCAFPDPDPEVMRHFANRFMIDDERRLMRVRLGEEECSHVR